MGISKKLTATLFSTVVFIVNISTAVAETGETLDSRQSAMVPIAAFTATGNIPKLETALNEGMDAGLTVNEVKEILVHSYAYAGFPRALNGINAYMAVLDKRKEQGITDTIGKEVTPMPSDFDKRAYGHKIRNALVGRDMSNRTSGYAAFTPIIDQFLVEHLFADIFYRDLLSHQDRELVTISMLSAMTGTEPQLNAHLGISMKEGLSKAQLDSFIALLGQAVSAESAKRASETLNDLLGAESPVNQAKSVKVIKSERPTKAPADFFTGKATVESQFASEPSDNYRGAIVNFEAGARTAWHTHPLGQTLIVISGRGFVQSEGEAVQEILPGDVVWIPANARHWHGAAPNSPLSHVAISTPQHGLTVEWMEHVSREQYGD